MTFANPPTLGGLTFTTEQRDGTNYLVIEDAGSNHVQRIPLASAILDVEALGHFIYEAARIYDST